MIVRPYEMYDETRLSFDTSQAYMGEFLQELDFDLEPLAQQDLVWTAEHDEKVIAMGGIVPIWRNRAHAWMWMSEESGKHMLGIHRGVKKFLTHSNFTRIEATVNIGFKPGTRWMKMLGFELEGYMRAYDPNGADMLLFARVRR